MRNLSVRKTVSAISAGVVISFAATLATAPVVSAQVVPVVGSIAAAIFGLKSLVKQIEDSAQSLMNSGDSKLARQQMMLAGTISSVITQVEKSYANSLEKTGNTLTTQEMNLRDDLSSLNKNLQGTVGLGSKELQSRIYQTQSTANQLLDKALPFSSRSPLVYSVQTRDLLQAFDEQPADVQVLGYLLADPQLNYKKPTVTVAGQALSEAAVSVEEGVVKIQLPEELRNKIKLANKPCDPIKTFSVELETYYVGWGGWFAGLQNLTGLYSKGKVYSNVTPGARRYDVAVKATGTQVKQVDETNVFERSSYVNFGCGVTQSGSVAFAIPENGANANIEKCSWIDVSNSRDASASPGIGGRNVTCAGSIRGRDREWTGNCPGGGHGTIFLRGSYTTKRDDSQPWKQETTAALVGPEVKFAIGDTNVSTKTVEIEVRRAACTAVLDSATVQVPNDRNQRVQQGSKGGFFAATLQRGDLTISKAPSAND